MSSRSNVKRISEFKATPDADALPTLEYTATDYNCVKIPRDLKGGRPDVARLAMGFTADALCDNDDPLVVCLRLQLYRIAAGEEASMAHGIKSKKRGRPRRRCGNAEDLEIVRSFETRRQRSEKTVHIGLRFKKSERTVRRRVRAARSGQ
jgi:hypothetical protein